MNWETWEKHKTALQNETWTAWAKWPADVQDAMRMIDPECRDFLRYDGVWQNSPGTPFLPGNVYRVTPAWPEPAKPDPVAEYEDCKVEVSGDGSSYIYTYEIGSCTHKRILSCAIGNHRFAGYVYTGKEGKPECCPALIFDQQADGTWRLRVPLAVRLRKEVTR